VIVDGSTQRPLLGTALAGPAGRVPDARPPSRKIRGRISIGSGGHHRAELGSAPDPRHRFADECAARLCSEALNNLTRDDAAWLILRETREQDPHCTRWGPGLLRERGHAGPGGRQVRRCGLRPPPLDASSSARAREQIAASGGECRSLRGGSCSRRSTIPRDRTGSVFWATESAVVFAASSSGAGLRLCPLARAAPRCSISSARAHSPLSATTPLPRPVAGQPRQLAADRAAFPSSPAGAAPARSVSGSGCFSIARFVAAAGPAVGRNCRRSGHARWAACGGRRHGGWGSFIEVVRVLGLLARGWGGRQPRGNGG